ncbi:MAG: lysylphosphatidylglycerol synthase transmembrane domain-containing protein [Patescibacteria group bacterium]
MKQSHKKILSIITFLALLFLAVYYLARNYASFQKLSLVSPELIVCMVLFFITSYVCMGMYTRSLLTPFGIVMRAGESFMLAMITGFYNLITPFRGGLVVRAAYLKKKYQFSYTDFLASLAGMYVIVFLISGLLGLFSILFIFQSTSDYNLLLVSIFSIVVIAMLVIIIFSQHFPRLNGRWLGKISRVAQGWNLIKNNTQVVFSVILFSLAQLLLLTLMLNLQFRVFGVNVSYFGTLILASMANLSLLISITPANLGINEAVIVFSAATLGISPTVSLASALLGRAVQIIVLFILGPIFSYKLIKKK